ncbi:MAG TPA: ATP-binding protein [Armatimonadota bacterium]|jgi:hypothetical protein
MFRRFITPSLMAALQDTPVVCLQGARQVGKSTLVRDLGRYVTLDDAGSLAAAASDPVSFLSELSRDLSGPLIVDEVQLAPQLFPALKLRVDRDRRPGQFLLTGSANLFLLPKLSESLAGRMEVLTLWPLAQAEVEEGAANLVDLLLSEESPLPKLRHLPRADRQDVLRRVLLGGFPEPLARPTAARRQAWFESYLTTLIQRDVRGISNIEGLVQLPRLLSLLATRCAMPLNEADVARGAGLPYTTLRRYMTLLEATYLVQLLPAWPTNRGNRVVKSPKLLFTDTGLAANLLRMDEAALLAQGSLLGQLVENHALMELRKLAGWSAARPSLYHWRTQTRQEVDLVLEGPAGGVVGVEVKSSATVSAADFKHLRALAEVCGTSFRRGVVLYTGDQVLPFGPNLLALPFSALWA